MFDFYETVAGIIGRGREGHQGRRAKIDGSVMPHFNAGLLQYHTPTLIVKIFKGNKVISGWNDLLEACFLTLAGRQSRAKLDQNKLIGIRELM